MLEFSFSDRSIPACSVILRYNFTKDQVHGLELEAYQISSSSKDRANKLYLIALTYLRYSELESCRMVPSGRQKQWKTPSLLKLCTSSLNLELKMNWYVVHQLTISAKYWKIESNVLPTRAFVKSSIFIFKLWSFTKLRLLCYFLGLESFKLVTCARRKQIPRKLMSVFIALF